MEHKSPAEIYSEAAKLAKEAAKKHIPTPMMVYNADIFGNRLSPNSYVSEGACGFAWVRIKPARGPFIKYLKENKIGGLSGYGGWTIWMGEFTSSQSIERKIEAAKAFVKVLKENGIERVWFESRLD